MYAVVEIAGKQFKVEPNSMIKVPLLHHEKGAEIEFDKVLLVRDGENVEIGNPVVENRTVKAKVLEHGRDKKIIVFKKKRRKGYRVKKGHRQDFTKIQITAL